MFPLMRILTALPWRLIGVGAVISMLFVGGCQYGEKRGEQRVTARWDAEKAATAVAVAHQAEHVAAVTAHESTINQEISNDFQKTKAAISTNGRDLLARVPLRVRLNATSRDSAVPSIPESSTGTVTVTANAVPVTEQSTGNAACEKLAVDAAQTTLMLLEFQRWYLLQHQVENVR